MILGLSIPWAIRNWKLIAGGAIVVALLGTHVTAYYKGRMDYAASAEVRAIKESLKRAKATAEADQKLALNAARQKEQLEKQIDELNSYVQGLEDADRQCLDATDTERLRQLWRK